MLLMNNINEVKKELHAKNERFSYSDDNEYQVMHRPYANQEEAFLCLNRVIAKNFSNPPQRQFKRINLVPLPTQGVNHHATNKRVISNKKALSEDQNKLEVFNNDLDCQLSFIELPKSQETQKKNELSGDGMFVKQKDFKGDYYYFCDDNQMKQHPKVYEDSLSKSINIKKQINSPLLFKRTLSCNETSSNSVQRIVPRRLAPPPPSNINVRNPINNSGPNTIEKKAKKPKLVRNNNIFEDFGQDSKFSNHAAQLRAQYEYLS